MSPNSSVGATDFKTPKVESTGTGGGFKLFCSGVGVQYPDITNASRRIKMSEVEACAANNVAGIVEVKLGYDGIVLANSRATAAFELTLEQVFLALAKSVPRPRKARRDWSPILTGSGLISTRHCQP